MTIRSAAGTRAGREPRARSCRILGVVAIAAVLAVCGLRSAPSAAFDPPVRVGAVRVVGMTVTDLARSVRFFRDVLDFEPIEETDVTGAAYARLWDLPAVRARRARLRLGGEEIELVEFATPKGRPFPDDARSDDRAFQHVAIVVADMDAAYARVRDRVVPISIGGPQTLPATNAAAAGIAAFYFRDPDGHALELIHFPPDKGDARWHDRPDRRLFLGIDHTAIAVRATLASLAFYRDLLGVEVGGESVNDGIEQARLTGVAGARVRITGLRPPDAVPGIELLEYTAPRSGRGTPDDPAANDVAHWYTRIVVPDVAAAARALRRARPAARADVVALPDPRLGRTRAVVARDPDGHTLELVEH